MAQSILQVNASARLAGSVSRQLTDKLVARLTKTGAAITKRDIGAEPLPILTEDWVNANFTPDENRTAEQRDILKLSDQLIAELEAADTLVLGIPIYNFGVPAAFKAWIDLIARARKTFRYSETGPVGLLEGKKAYVVITSGGTESGSGIDFATPYVRHVLGFIGIKDVSIIAADQLMATGEEKVATAATQIESLAA